MHLVTTWFGSFLVDEGAVVEKRLFPRDPEALADRLALVEDWKVLPEERELMAGRPGLFGTETRLERAGGQATAERGQSPRPRGLRGRPHAPPRGDARPGEAEDAEGGRPGRPPPPGRGGDGRPPGDAEPAPGAAAGVVRPPLPGAREDRGRPGGRRAEPA